MLVGLENYPSNSVKKVYKYTIYIYIYVCMYVGMYKCNKSEETSAG